MFKNFSHFTSSSNSTSSSFVKWNFALQTIAKPFGSKHLIHGVQWPILMTNTICLRWLVWIWHLWIAINNLVIEKKHFLSIYLARIPNMSFQHGNCWKFMLLYVRPCQGTLVNISIDKIVLEPIKFYWNNLFQIACMHI